MVTAVKGKSLDHYLQLKYAVTLIPDVTGGYAAEIEDLPGCISQGDTAEEAMEMIEEARQLWLESAYEDGLDIPEPRTEEEYSGKFNVRVPKDLHRKLAGLAVRQGVSLNQLVVATLAEAVGRKTAQTGEAMRAAEPKAKYRSKKA